MDATQRQLKERNGQPLQNQQPPADSIHGDGTDEQIDAALKARNEGGGK